jgi:metal-responsive CopG/Arc/MetJ family transcriptional regulator
MKEKTSVTLSKDILSKVDRLAGARESRSSFIERILRNYLRERKRAAMNARDLKRINEHAARLNKEAEDVLEYQAAGQ